MIPPIESCKIEEKGGDPKNRVSFLSMPVEIGDKYVKNKDSQK